MKRKLTIIFIILSIVFAILSMPMSGALSTGKLERNTSLRVVGDTQGVLKLEGFQNKTINMNNRYTNFGTITNNTLQIMKLTIIITPEINWFNAISTLGIKIGNEIVEFRYLASSPLQIVVTLSPGQTVNASSFLINNVTSIKTTFQFLATDLGGTYTIKLSDSANAPRNIICY
ncbi:MAG: hypothetical protein QM644_17010 [Mobilitalea sp.]